MFLQHFTCHFLHIVNPLILHGFKMLIGRLITRVSQQNTGSRYDLLKKKKTSKTLIISLIAVPAKPGSDSRKQLRSVTHDSEQRGDKQDRVNVQLWHTCGVKSLVDLTAAWIPSTVLLLAVPTAAAFSAVAPSLLAWFSKLAALSSNT